MTAPQEPHRPPAPPDRLPSPRGGHPSPSTASAAARPGFGRLAGTRRGLVHSVRTLAAAALLALFGALALPATAQAQSAGVLVSNIEQTESGGGTLANVSYLPAQGFSVPSVGGDYTLTSIEVVFDSNIGATQIGSLSVSVWSADSSGSPASSLHTLTNPASVAADVATSFTAPAGATLAAGNTYLVVADYNLAGSSVTWSATTSASEDATSVTDWTIADNSWFRARAGASWTSTDHVLFLRVNGTAVGGTTPPDAPTDFTAKAGNMEVALAWKAPALDSGVTGHEFRYKTDGDYPLTWTAIANSAPDEANEDSFTVTMLTNEVAYTFELHAVSAGVNSDAVTAGPVTPMLGICDRTQKIQDAILGEISGVDNCAAVTDANLAAITSLGAFGLSTSNQGITSLQKGDFAGLTALTVLDLSLNRLSSLPEGIFADLAKMDELNLRSNKLESLPEGVFDGLVTLRHINLSGNSFTELRAGAFAGLSALQIIELTSNDLSSLPEELFSGLTALIRLTLDGNSTNPMELTVTVEKVGTNQVRAKVLAGAPFAVAIPVTLVNGTLAGSVTELSVAAGEVYSEPVTVTRTAGTTAAATVDVDLTTQPTLPGNHRGYTFVKATVNLPATILPDATNAAPAFTSSTTFNPAENQTAVGTVEAEDIDTTDDITGYALNGGTDQALFAITSGALTFQAAPNYEDPQDAGTDNAYVVVVRATSGTGARVKTADQTITVTVMDEDEQPDKPDKPTVTAVSGSSTSLDVSWTEPGLNGGPEITGYQLRYRSRASATDPWSPAVDWPHTGTTTTTTITGLTATTEYVVQVKALNGETPSTYSNPSDVVSTNAETPGPAAPTNFMARPAGDAKVALSWDAPASDSGVMRHEYQFKTDGSYGNWVQIANSEVGGANQASFTASGLTNEVPHTFQLRAVSADGAGGEAMAGPVTPTPGICDRTQQVQDEILTRLSAVSDCAAVTVADLATVTVLVLEGKRITSLKAGDFAGLTAVTYIGLNSNRVTSLPETVFSGLTALETLDLEDNVLSVLPAEVFSGLTALETLDLSSGNVLSSLPGTVFSELSSLTFLSLENIGITELSAGLFSGLSKLEGLNLGYNQLTSLPDGLFSGLTGLTALSLTDNPAAGDVLPLTVTLETAEDGQVRAKVLAGAPSDLVLPVIVENGTLAFGATGLRVAKGSVAGVPVSVIRTEETGDVTVDLGTPLPSLPPRHSGYEYVKAASGLPVEVPDALEREPGVEGEFRLAPDTVEDYSDDTEGHLNGHVARVEVFHAGRWGTVCSDGFSKENTFRFVPDLDADGDPTGTFTETEPANNAPALVCQSMGYDTGEYASGYGQSGVPSQTSEPEMTYYPVGSSYPADGQPGPLPIWLDDLTCAAGDADLTGESALRVRGLGAAQLLAQRGCGGTLLERGGQRPGRGGGAADGGVRGAAGGARRGDRVQLPPRVQRGGRGHARGHAYARPDGGGRRGDRRGPRRRGERRVGDHGHAGQPRGSVDCSGPDGGLRGGGRGLHIGRPSPVGGAGAHRARPGPRDRAGADGELRGPAGGA